MPATCRADIWRLRVSAAGSTGGHVEIAANFVPLFSVQDRTLALPLDGAGYTNVLQGKMVTSRFQDRAPNATWYECIRSSTTDGRS